MNIKLFSLNSKKIAVGFLLFIITLLILRPSFSLPWSLIDDGVSVTIGEKFLKAITSFNFIEISKIVWESQVGRFRPVYWLYNGITVLIGGTNPSAYHFLRFINFWIVSWIVFLTAKKIGNNVMAGFFAFAVFVFSFLPFENWYRLGTQEPLIILCLSLSLLLLIERKIYLSIVPLIISFFIKETDIFIIGGYLFLFLINQKFKILDGMKLARALLVIFSGAIIIFLASFIMRQGSYADNYSFDLKKIMVNLSLYSKYLFLYYGYFFPLGLVSIVFFIKKRDKFFWVSFILVSALIMFSTILPWTYVLGRYLLPFTYYLSLLTGIGLYGLIIVLKKYKFIQILILLYFFGTLIHNGVMIAGTFLDYSKREGITGEMVTYIAKNSEKNSNVYLNLNNDDSTIEYYEELKIHLANFYNRPDIKIHYLENINDPKPGDLVVEGYLKPRFLDLANNYTFDKDIETRFQTLILTTPIEFVKKTAKWGWQAINGNGQMPEGIYAVYNGYYFWRIFKV